MPHTDRETQFFCISPVLLCGSELKCRLRSKTWSDRCQQIAGVGPITFKNATNVIYRRVTCPSNCCRSIKMPTHAVYWDVVYIPANWGRGRGRQQAFRREFKLRSRWTFRDQRLRQPTSRPAGPINSSVSCQSDSRACVNHALIIPTVIETSLCHCLLRPRAVCVDAVCSSNVVYWRYWMQNTSFDTDHLFSACIGKTALNVKKMTTTGCTKRLETKASSHGQRIPAGSSVSLPRMVLITIYVNNNHA